MTTLAADPPARHAPPALFAITVFTSAALVFLVQPMVAKLVLPMLGGSSSVWNTSMAFFQIALLAGYAYAHLLQRIASVRSQALIHCAALVIAAVALPLRVNGLAGPPSSEARLRPLTRFCELVRVASAVSRGLRPGDVAR